VAPAISCQINFNLIKFFHFAQSQKINENFCQINVKKLTHCKAFEGCALLPWWKSQRKGITAAEIFTNICSAPLTFATACVGVGSASLRISHAWHWSHFSPKTHRHHPKKLPELWLEPFATGIVQRSC